MLMRLKQGPSNDRRTPQDAADRHRTLFLVIFWAPLRSRQQLTMIWINAKLSQVYFKFNFDLFNFTQSYISRQYRCRRSLPQDVTSRRRALYSIILLCRLVEVIDVLGHSCGQVDWQLTEQNYTYSKNSNNITRIVSCGGLWRPAVIGRTAETSLKLFQADSVFSFYFRMCDGLYTHGYAGRGHWRTVCDQLIAQSHYGHYVLWPILTGKCMWSFLHGTAL